MEKVTIGADPEFVIKYPGRDTILPANDICNPYGMLGTDTVEDLVEIRPNPSMNVFNVLGNIRYALRFLLDKSPKLQKMEFIAGHKGVNQSIGGHIHLGRSPKKAWFDETLFSPSGEPIGNDSNKGIIIIAMLDKLLYNGLHRMIQDKDGYNFRIKSSYGNKGNYRMGHRKSIIEYRTPPSWLVSPTLAFFYLCLAKVGGLLTLNYESLAKEIIRKRIIGINLLKYTSNKVKDIDELQSESDIHRLNILIKDIKFKEGQVRNWSRDFKKAWGL